MDSLLQISVVIFLLPLVTFVILIFFGKRMGDKPSSLLGTSIMGLNLLLSLYVFAQKLFFREESPAYIQEKFEWFNLGPKHIFEVGIGIDNIAAIMLVVVTLISFLVHLFSTEYMHGDKRFPRFYAYLGIFTFSMLGIVLANNFLFMYVFWELVGLSSYLLIGFWYEKDSAANASKKAFLTNRVGDFGFFAGIMILYFTYHTVLFDDIFSAIGMGTLPFESGDVLTLAGILIFMGAVGKSAQFPLHVWLPDAMEGPTPVSALIHAATMVAAGVYLVARVFPMLTADALTFIAYVGAITAFMAATIAITQNDFKKVLAYSTVSQLGYMVMGLGVGVFTSGFFHLVTHAWFKGALFLGSGSVIHAMHHSMHKAHNHSMDPQDIRNMGGLRNNMKTTYATFLIMTLAIAGVPFFSGFLSKDGILAGTLAYAMLTGHWMIPIAGFGAAAITAFYMFRLVIVSFHGKHKTDIAAQTHENKWVITTPLIILTFLTMFFVYTWNPIDPSVGWFHAKVQAPESVVPAEFQHDFMLPADHQEDAHAAHNHMAHAGHDHGEEASATDEHAGHDHSAHAADSHADETVFEHTLHVAHYPAMGLSLLVAFLGILGAFMIYQFKVANPDNFARFFGKLYKGSLNKWYFDEIYDKTFISGTMVVSVMISWFDSKIVDGIVNGAGWITDKVGWVIGKFDNLVIDGIVNLLANIVGFFGAMVRKFQTGRVQTYVAFVIIAIMVVTLWIL